VSGRRRFISHAGTTVVATIAAYASYEHMVSLALKAHQTPTIAALLPLSVDGLVIVASVALVDGRQRRGSAWFAFLLGVSASIVANILAAGPHLLDRCVSAWPSVALLVTIEVITHGGRTLAKSASAGPIPSSDDAIALRDSDVKTEPSAPAGRPAAKATRAKPAAPRKSTRTAAKVAKTAASMPGASRTEIAARAGVSEPTARRYLTPPGAPNGVNGAAVLDEVTV
jgi:hypothetical protein